MSQIDLDLPTDFKFNAVLIFGPPGAGKGTMSAQLSQVCSMYHLSTGDIFRGIPPESNVGQLLNSYSSAGRLVPDEVAIQIWHYYVKGLVATNRFDPFRQQLLLDGIPRTQAQVEALKPYCNVEKILFLDVKDDDVLVRRIQGRSVGSGRADDAKEDVIRVRLQAYKTETESILEKYDPSIVRRIDASQPIPAVLRDVLDAVSSD